MPFGVLIDFRVPEPLTKKIIWQTLHAVDFCHQHNVWRFISVVSQKRFCQQIVRFCSTCA